MSADRPLDSSWRDILALGRELLRQSDPAAQAALVTAAVNKLISGHVDLWLDHAVLRQSGVPAPPDLPDAPSSALMRRALEARRIQFADLADGTHAVAAPLSAGGLALGALQVRRDGGTPFTEADIELFALIADQAAAGLQGARQMAVERWRCEVADGLREVVGLLSTNVSPEQVLDVLLAKAEQTLACQAAAIWLVQDNNLCMAAVHGAPADMCVSHMATSSTWLYEALDVGLPTIRPRGGAREPLGLALGLRSNYSAIAAPLRIADRPALGLLTLVHPDPGRYGDEARVVVAAFASSAAVAIENARLYRSAQEQAWVSTVMLEIARSTQSLRTLDEVIETVVRLVPMLADVKRCAVVLWDEATRMFRPAAANGLGSAELSAFKAQHIDPASEPAFEHMRSFKTPLGLDSSTSDRAAFGRVLAELGFEAPALLPLLAQGELVGALLLDRRIQGDSNSVGSLISATIGRNDWMAVVQGIAYQTAAAVENAQLRQALQEEAYVSSALLQVAQAIASLSDVDEILSAIVRITPALVGVERCAIYLWEPETRTFQPTQAYGVSRAREAQFAAQRFALGEFPLLDSARERGGPVAATLGQAATGTVQPAEPMLPSTFLDTFDRQSTPARRTVASGRSFLAVPLLAQAEVIGVMVVEETGQPRSSEQRRLEIITGIASQAAVAVQNGRLQAETARRLLLEQELQLAREIQQSLMPQQLPTPAGWEIAAVCRPARQVGGDFFDLFELPGSRLALVIADVADKGMPAALFMALTHALIRTVAAEEASPAAVLTRVNGLMVPDARHGMFVTAFYAVLALDTGSLNYANAGHNLPLMVRSASGLVERLSKGQIALGVTTDVRWEDRRLSLECGDSLILYTDGVTEAFSAQQDAFYGEERLEQLLGTSRVDPAQDLLNRIIESVDAFASGTPQSDDLTGVVIRRVP